MKHEFSFHFRQAVIVGKCGHAIEIEEPDCEVEAAIGPDNRQPDGWNVDGLYLVTWQKNPDRQVDVKLGLRSKRVLVPLQEGTPFFAQAMAYFAEHEANKVSVEWDRLRELGEAA